MERHEKKRVSFLRRLSSAVRGAHVGDRIDALVAKRRFQEALDLLEAELANRDYPVSWRVWELQLHHLLAHDAWVVDRAPAVLAEIPKDRYLNEDERRYLTTYASLAAQYSMANICGDKEQAALRFPVSYSGLDLAKVSSLLRRTLPMDTHPDWQRWRAWRL